jgi:hypothetical protein
MSNLPVIAAVEELKDSNTDNRKRLQKSMRAGLLNVVKSVQSLELTLTNAFKAQMEQAQRDEFSRLEALRELARAQESTSDTQKDDNKKMGTIDGKLVAMSALTAVIASMTGFDDWIKALRIPALMKNVQNTFTRTVDSIKNMRAGIFRVAGFFNAIKWADYIPTLRFPDGTSFADNVTKLVSNLRNNISAQFTRAISSVRAIFPIAEWKDTISTKALNFKAAILSPINNAISKLKLDFKVLKIPSFPELKWPKVVTDIKLPTVELPDNLKNFKLPVFPDLIGENGFLTKTKNFIFGAGEAAKGGLVGFFSGIADTVGKIPGLKAGLRIVGGPWLQGFISLIDFVTGFYKGFTDQEAVYDSATGQTFMKERSLTDRILGGLEGGILGLIKGITGAFDALFIRLPAWLLEKLGMEDAANFLREFSLTDLVDPIWNGIKNIFKFFSDPEYRKEQVELFKGKFTNMLSEAIENIRLFFADLLDKINPFNSNKDSLTSADLLASKRKALGEEMSAAATAQDMDAMAEITKKMKALDNVVASVGDDGLMKFQRDLDKDGKFSEAETFAILEKALAATTPTDGGTVLQKSSEQSAREKSIAAPVQVATSVDQSSRTQIDAGTTVHTPPAAKPMRLGPNAGFNTPFGQFRMN